MRYQSDTDERRDNAAGHDSAALLLTFRLGVNGSGSLIERGNAERIKFLSCTHVDGITSQKDK